MPERFDRILTGAKEVVGDFGRHEACDLESARAIATAALETYGDFDEAAHAQFVERGIWNDHAAVQAALAAVRMMRVELRPFTRADTLTFRAPDPPTTPARAGEE